MGTGLPLVPMSTARGDNDDDIVVDAAITDSSQTQPSATSRPHRTLLHRRAHLITSARRSPSENRRSRETKYLILQGLRIPFVLLSIASVLWWHNWWLALVFFCISIPLPWISVVIANDSNEVRDKRTQNVYKPAAARHQMLVAHQQAQLSSGRTDSGEQDENPGTIDHI